MIKAPTKKSGTGEGFDKARQELGFGSVGDFKSSHWDEPNVISHIRMNERTYQGKKVAFMEELQSDWAREGRSKGFAQPLGELDLPSGWNVKKINKSSWKALDNGDYAIEPATFRESKFEITKRTNSAGNSGYVVYRDGKALGTGNRFRTIDKAKEFAEDYIDKEWQVYDGDGMPVGLGGVDKGKVITEAKKTGFFVQGQIPNNPLLKNWQELSIKRALQDAVDSKAEYFSWINGEQTSARYTLATQIDNVQWRKSSGVNTNKVVKLIDIDAKDKGLFTVGINKEGIIVEKPASAPQDWSGKKLDEVLGKGLADKIMEKESGTLSGEGLKFGGEWANNLYDKQVGNIVSDLTGAKVEVLDLGLPIDAKYQKQIRRWEDTFNKKPLKNSDLKVGVDLDISDTRYIITDILGDGKFKAVPKTEHLRLSNAMKDTEHWGKNATPEYIKRQTDSQMERFKETFDISTKKTTQQGIKLTPEIKALVRGEAPTIKQPSGLLPKIVKTKGTKELPEGLPKLPKVPSKIPQITFVQLDDLAEKIKSQHITEQKFEEIKMEIINAGEVLENMPAKQLVKYVSKTTGRLPEVTGTKTIRSLTGSGKVVPNSEFGIRGDAIISELGRDSFSTVEEAQDAVDSYLKLRNRFNELKKQGSEIRVEKIAVRKGERLMQLAKGDRRMAYRAVRDAFDLTDADLAKIRQGKDIMAMSKEEFDDFIRKAEIKAEIVSRIREAQTQLEATIREKELSKWENVREAMSLPPVSQMNPEQLNKLEGVLSQYKTADEFLPVRQLETIDRTELKGLRTVREVRGHLAKKYSLTPDQLPNIKPHPWMYDAQLARQHPLYDLLVDKYNVSYLNATSRIIELEKENTVLINAARQSVKRDVAEKLVPTDKKIIEWIEASPETRELLAKNMTPEELKAGYQMDGVFREYYDWLAKRSVENKFSSRFEDKYFPHVRRGFLEAWKEDGFMKSLKEQFDQFKQEEKLLTILDSKTGDILPYEKWIGFTQFRTGGLVPTQNAAKAFKTYVTSLEKARQFDEFIPEIMIYVHSLSPKGLTARGVELDDSLKRFVKTWINSKKGRVQQQIIKPGSRMDWALRMGLAVTRIRDLGLNIPIGIANIFGEQAGNLTMLGAKNYATGIGRLATPKGIKITKQYENFVGKTLWDKLTEASNTVGDQLLAGIFGLFGIASRKGSQIFLLGSMTADEFSKGIISVERLAQLRKGMGKYRIVEGAESVFGKSVESAVGGQYKKWAIPILTSTANNTKVLAKIIREQGVKSALSSKEGSELFYSVVLGSAVGLGVMGYYEELKEKKDKNLIEDIIFKTIRDSLSMIGVLNPKFLGSFAAPRLASFIVDLGEAIDSLLFMERYKTTGELKGAKQLEKLFTPLTVKSLLGGEEKTEPKSKKLKTPPGLPELPSLRKILPTPPGLPKLP
ncbi:MAG: hypothetical protein Q8Q96_01090 [bacterium]|nr:hypothetical protein [bacterium]